jgi:cysteine-rich repeat protein
MSRKSKRKTRELRIAGGVLGCTLTLTGCIGEAPPEGNGTGASSIGSGAIEALSGCTTNTLARNDDGSTSVVSLGFTINFFSVTRTDLYVNNNGNVTFGAPMSTYTPFNLYTAGRQLIAPFFGDVDTRNSGSDVVRYGQTTRNGHSAFCVNWAGVGVGYYNQRVDKLNKFQLILESRPDTGNAQNFDIIFNYDQIQWETGEASGGVNGLGGSPARAGYSNGVAANSYELPGSGVRGAFLDTNASSGLIYNHTPNTTVPGRYIYEVRNGRVPICGDNFLDSGEQCDDGNTTSGDGCSARCQIEVNNAPTAVCQSVTVTADPTTCTVVASVNNGSSDPDGDAVTVSQSPAGPYALGTTMVSLTVTDTHNASAMCTAAVTVVDRTAPAIVCPAPAPAECGGSATTVTLSASAMDTCTAATVTGPTSAGYPLGTTSVTFSAADTAGNTSSCTTRVTVVDTTAPTLTANAGASSVECGGSYADPGATATDVCAGDLSGAVTASGSVNAAAVGAYTINYAVSDPSGHTASASRTVNVVDTTAPTLTLRGASSLTLECGGPAYVEQGATATDVCTGDLSGAVTTSGSVNAGAVGVYTVSYAVSDASGNASSTSRAVNVVDTTAPVVTGRADAITLWPPDHTLRTYRLSDCVTAAADQCDGALDVNAAGRIVSIASDEVEDARGGGDGATRGDMVIVSGSEFQVRAERLGSSNGRVYTVTYRVTDRAGRTSTATCRLATPHDESGRAAVDDGASAGYTIP